MTPRREVTSAARSVDELARAVTAALGHPATGAEVLAEVRGERVVARVTCGEVTVVAKWSAPPAGWAGATVQRALGQALDAAATAVVPTVLAADPATGVVISSELGHGTLAAPGAATTSRLERAGRAVAEVHAAPTHHLPDLCPVTMLEHLTDLVAPHPLVLADQAPRWAPVISAALDHLTALGPTATEPCLIHRDLNLRNLIEVPAGPTRTSPGIGIVDWDLAALGDPLFDVAYLLAHLETHGDDRGPWSAFLDGYRSHPAGARRLAQEGVAERLAAYRIFNLVRRACRRHRLADAGWLAERDRMLTLTADALGVPVPPGAPS